MWNSDGEGQFDPIIGHKDPEDMSPPPLTDADWVVIVFYAVSIFCIAFAAFMLYTSA